LATFGRNWQISAWGCGGCEKAGGRRQRAEGVLKAGGRRLFEGRRQRAEGRGQKAF
jgi:hypothetical protein